MAAKKTTTAKPKAPVKAKRPAKPKGPSREEVFAKICGLIGEGVSLREICKQDDMPDRMTVFRWLSDSEAFRDQYAHAREVQADTIFDEILQIADDARNDWMERNDEGNAGYDFNGEHVQRAKLRIEARKWMAGKLRPKKYGDKIDMNVSGGLVIEGAEVKFVGDEE